MAGPCPLQASAPCVPSPCDPSPAFPDIQSPEHLYCIACSVWLLGCFRKESSPCSSILVGSETAHMCVMLKLKKRFYLS